MAVFKTQSHKIDKQKIVLQKWKMLTKNDFYNKFSISDPKMRLKGVPELLVPRGPGGPIGQGPS